MAKETTNIILKKPEDSPQQIADKLNSLHSAVDISVIKGALPREEFEIYKKNNDKVVAGYEDRVNYNIKNGRKVLDDMRWHGGGGSSTGGSGTPGGSDTQVQFNDSGSFGGDVSFTWDKTTKNLAIGDPGYADATVQVQALSSTKEVDIYAQSDSSGQSFELHANNNGSFLNLTSPTTNGIFLSTIPGDNSIIDIPAGGSTSPGSMFSVNAGPGGATSGAGGSINLTAGSAQGGNSDGGGVTINSGAKTGAGSEGFIDIEDINGAYGLYTDSSSLELFHSTHQYQLAAGSGVAILDTSGVNTSNKTFTFPNQSGTFVTSTSATGAPVSTPTAIGQVFVATSTKKIYFSTGTSSSADWTIVN